MVWRHMNSPQAGSLEYSHSVAGLHLGREHGLSRGDARLRIRFRGDKQVKAAEPCGRFEVGFEVLAYFHLPCVDRLPALFLEPDDVVAGRRREHAWLRQVFGRKSYLGIAVLVLSRVDLS